MPDEAGSNIAGNPFSIPKFDQTSKWLEQPLPRSSEAAHPFFGSFDAYTPDANSGLIKTTTPVIQGHGAFKLPLVARAIADEGFFKRPLMGPAIQSDEFPKLPSMTSGVGHDISSKLPSPEPNSQEPDREEDTAAEYPQPEDHARTHDTTDGDHEGDMWMTSENPSFARHHGHKAQGQPVSRHRNAHSTGR